MERGDILSCFGSAPACRASSCRCAEMDRSVLKNVAVQISVILAVMKVKCKALTFEATHHRKKREVHAGV